MGLTGMVELGDNIFPYRLSWLYKHDIIIDVTNKHELFSLGIKAGN